MSDLGRFEKFFKGHTSCYVNSVLKESKSGSGKAYYEAMFQTGNSDDLAQEGWWHQWWKEKYRLDIHFEGKVNGVQ